MTDQQPDFYEDLAHELQYGDTASAAQKLRERDRQLAAGAKYEQELAKSQGVLDAFTKKHKDIADDKYLSASAERDIYEQYVSDIKASGVPDAEIPRSLDQIAAWHLRMRAEQNPHARPLKQIFEQSAQNVRDWKAGRAPRNATPSGSNPFQDPLVTGLPLGLVGRDGDEPDVGRSRAVEMMKRNREGLRNPTASTLHRPIERPAWEGSE